MSSSQKLKSNLRSWASKPLIFFLTTYVISLTCSIAGMEISAWGVAVFFLIYYFFDRIAITRNIELHTIGIELPLLLLFVAVIVGLRVNAPGADFFTTLGSLRNLALLFIFCFSLQIYKNLNRIMMLILTCATLTSFYGIWQHFSGIDLVRADHRVLTQVPWGDGSVFSTIGFFNNHLTYGHCFMMILCIPWAALLLAKRPRWWHTLLLLISFSAILTSLVFTYGRGVWIAVLVALPFMAFYASRKLFLLTLGILVVVGGIVLKRDPLIRERAQSIIAENNGSNEERRKLWEANVEMFHDHPWIGVGYKQNEAVTDTYFKKLAIQDGVVGNAHSNYIELLATTGMLGFVSYMLFILAFILMTARLYATIPSTHYWHKVFVLSALGAQISFHVGGLTQWNFGDPVVQHLFLFWLAVIAYMSQRYYAHIVPDDHSL